MQLWKTKFLVINFLVMLMSAGSQSAPALLPGGGRPSIAIVYLEKIKPYQALSDAAAAKLQSDYEISSFLLAETGSNGDDIVNQLKAKKPDLIICLGNLSFRLTHNLGIAPIVVAYDISVLNEQNPLCMIQYINPNASTVSVIAGEKSPAIQKRIEEFAVKQGLSVSFIEEKQCTWEQIFRNGSVYFGKGILGIKINQNIKPIINKPVVAVVNSKTKELLDEFKLPFDKVIEISSESEPEKIKNEIQAIGPALIATFGVDAYFLCKELRNQYPIMIMLKTSHIAECHWGRLSGVSMFVEPQKELDALAVMVKREIKLAVPFDPDKTELFVLKALLTAPKQCELVPIPVGDQRKAIKVMKDALAKYDGLFIIPDTTVTIGPLRKMVLEESLLNKKILIAMMHSYTQDGALMAFSAVGRNENSISDKVVELSQEMISAPKCGLKLVSPEPSISVNLKTSKLFGYEFGTELLEKADFVYGEK